MAGTLTSPRTVSVAPRPFPRTIMARILLIDDDDLLRELLATTLAHAGHTVHQAAEGGQGCEIFRTTPVDLVITDIIMPGQEGIETILHLRHLNPRLPIIAMSGGATNSKIYLTIAAQLGASHVLAKPFTLDELAAALADLLPPASPLASPSSVA